MRNGTPLLPVRQEQRNPCRDFWAMIRWGVVLGSGVWIIVTALERITTL